MAGKFMDDEEMKGMSFGHAGTIVEGVEDTATEKIARLEAAGIRVVERIDEIPDRGQGEARGARLMAEELNKVFIEVEVDASVAGDAAVAAKLEEVCPVDIFKDADGQVEIVDEQPRRVRPLQALPRSGARRHRPRAQALRRHRALAPFHPSPHGGGRSAWRKRDFSPGIRFGRMFAS